ncbi:zinc-binding dehydrogenase [Nocardiopsis sp. MG754419]|uniref:zinc-binding dehydrogenase n=1 Tax=Nocardiopsis sp. MG754419 TaxID=2259865 RepID=UPI0027DD03B2|nr:zinc-binding dehydrogenase [Nocardiopsis sp. MG754419]
MRFFSGDPRQSGLDALARHVEQGELRPAVDTVFPLEETAAAHRALEAGGVRGRYVVSVT